MGSLATNGEGAFAYRSSKVALNMAVRCFAKANINEGVHCLLLHPGHVKTDMGGIEGDIDIDTSVKGMKGVVEKIATLPIAAEHDGFFAYDGSTIPW